MFIDEKKRDFNLSDRFLEFGVDAIKLTSVLNKAYSEKHVGKQLLRSATSTGANYEEACGAESRADFVHKMKVVYKELKESLYWLKLLRKAELGNPDSITKLMNEADELTRITNKSITTASKGKQ